MSDPTPPEEGWKSPPGEGWKTLTLPTRKAPLTPPRDPLSVPDTEKPLTGPPGTGWNSAYEISPPPSNLDLVVTRDEGTYELDRDAVDAPWIPEDMRGEFVNVVKRAKNPQTEQYRIAERTFWASMGLPTEIIKIFDDAIDTGARIGTSAREGMRTARTAWDAGMLTRQMGKVAWEGVFAEDDAEILKQFQEMQGQLPDPEKMKGFIARTTQFLSSMLGARWEGLKTGAALSSGGMLALSLLAAVGAPASAGLTALLIPGLFTSGMIAGSVKETGVVEGGLVYADLRLDQDAQGKMIPREIAQSVAAAVGAVNAGIESLQVSSLVRTIPGLNKIVGNVSKGVVYRALMNGQFRKWGWEFAAKSIGRGIDEAMEEALQESTVRIFTEIARGISNEFEGTGFEHEWERLIPEATEAFTSSLLPSIAIGAPGTMMSASRAHRTARVQSAVSQTQDAVSDLESTMQKNPDQEADAQRAIHVESEARAGQVAQAIAVQDQQKAEVATGQKVESGTVGGENTAAVPEFSTLKATERSLLDSYEQIKDSYFAERDEGVLAAKVKMANTQEEVLSALKKKHYDQEARDIDTAMALYVEMKTYPEARARTWDNLTQRQKELVQLAERLPDPIKAIADRLEADYKLLGQQAMDAEVIHTLREAYVAHLWGLDKRRLSELQTKFKATTEHALYRKFETILDGWTEGLELRVEGATQGLRVMEEHIRKVTTSKRFKEQMRATRGPEGKPMLTHRHLEGYKRVDVPGMKSWAWAGATKPEAISRLMREFVVETRAEAKAPQKAPQPIVKLENVIRDALVSRGFTQNEAETAISAVRRGQNTEETIQTIERTVREREVMTGFKMDPVFDRNVIVLEDGTVLKKVDMYAPEAVAKNLNNIFGTSWLMNVPGFKDVTRFNAQMKRMILTTSFFHHQAFLASYYFGSALRAKWADLSPRQAYRNGYEAIRRMDPVVVNLVRNGLTLGVKADWEVQLLNERTRIGQFVDSLPVAGEIKKKLQNLRQAQEEFLFEKFGAGLKAKVGMLEYANQLKRFPDADPNTIAKRVANLVNDDFGGLHLERMGRNPTLQHLFRLFTLAPDWTESNVRTMVKAFKAGEEGALYRRFWARAILRGQALTVLANYALSGGDPEEMERRYRRAWEAGRLRVMEVDITPIYEMLGGDDGDPRYWNMWGHFKDPFRFIADPMRIGLQAKGSYLTRLLYNAAIGKDWLGRKFTTVDELMDTGKTVAFRREREPWSEWEWYPSFIINQTVGSTPIQIQNLIRWTSGEMEAFEAILTGLGFRVVKARLPEVRRRL